MQITEDLLMAYADGEADAETRAQIEAAMAIDGTIRDRVEAHRRLRGTLAGAFGSALTEPVPERLTAAARGESAARAAEIVDLAAVRARKAAPKPAAPPQRAWVQWSALAACLAIGVILARGLGSVGSTALIGDRHGTLMAQGALSQALDQQITGAAAAPDQAVRIGVSFRATDKVYCRTFQVVRGDGLAGLACRAPSGWQVRVAAVPASHDAGHDAGATAYRTAGSAIPAAVSATVDAIIDGSPLDARAEAAAKAKGWRE